MLHFAEHATQLQSSSTEATTKENVRSFEKKHAASQDPSFIGALLLLDISIFFLLSAALA